MRPKTSWWVAALACTACGAGPGVPAVPTELAPAPPLRLVWSDEFDGAQGEPVDPAKWSAQVGGTGWGQNLLDYKTNCTDPSAPNYTTENAQMDGLGNLVISAIRRDVPHDTCWYGACEFTSALLVTSSTFQRQYGRFEVRMKTPPGPGLWVSFWLFSDDDSGERWGEIDVVEVIGREPAAIFQAAHGPGFTADKVSKQFAVRSGIVADAFHVYAVDWSPGELRYFIDGGLSTVITPRALPPGADWPFDSLPSHMVLDLSVGSNSSWSGSQDARTPFPAELVVDYVRVYEIE